MKRRVSPSQLYYNQNTLELIFEEEIPALYEKDIDKVKLHADKDSCDTSVISLAKKKELKRGIKCILFDEILVKSSDSSSIDFCAFGLLKRALGKRHPRTLNGLRQTIQAEVNKIGLTVLRKSLLSRKIRVRVIVKNHGFQIETNPPKKKKKKKIRHL
ncbi:uncharacterized protein TNCV_1593511 [Trichonephila clavipes]|nr:uncharacterized protein TNCV_1593511 [Trichonephila clavipes]